MCKVRVRPLQLSVRRLDREANYEAVRELAAQGEADLLVLPELFDTGYLFHDRKELLSVATPARGGETCAFLARLARGSGCHVVAGFAERDGPRCFNSAALVGPQGLVGLYRKVHLFSAEKELFAPGDLGFPVFDLGFARVGLMICFDWIFPEAARTLALRGAQVLAHPANLVLPWCQAAMATRALENGVFIITANRIGSEEVGGRRLTFTGGSQVVGPRGEMLLSAPRDAPAGLAVALELARADDKRITPENSLLGDRRPEAYSL